MPNALASSHQLCLGRTSAGSPCGCVRLRGKEYCAAHLPKGDEDPSRPAKIVPNDSLPVLSRLDLSDPASLSRLRRGLFQHVLAGNIGQADANAALRFAEAEHAASAKGRDDGMKDVLKAVMAQPPPPAD